MKVELKCAQCGVAVRRSASRVIGRDGGYKTVTCSTPCLTAYRRKAAAEKLEALRRNCKHCDVSFLPRRADERPGGGAFCSRACHNDHRPSRGEPALTFLIAVGDETPHPAGYTTAELHEITGAPVHGIAELLNRLYLNGERGVVRTQIEGEPTRYKHERTNEELFPQGCTDALAGALGLVAKPIAPLARLVARQHICLTPDDEAANDEELLRAA